jgi:hypothetical protein
VTAPAVIIPPFTFKACSACGRGYTREEWLALPLVGIQPDLGGGSMELRNCVCRSTLAVDRCWHCEALVGDSEGSRCECRVIVTCAECGPAKHLGCNP